MLVGKAQKFVDQMLHQLYRKLHPSINPSDSHDVQFGHLEDHGGHPGPDPVPNDAGEAGYELLGTAVEVVRVGTQLLRELLHGHVLKTELLYHLTPEGQWSETQTGKIMLEEVS